MAEMNHSVDAKTADRLTLSGMYAGEALALVELLAVGLAAELEHDRGASLRAAALLVSAATALKDGRASQSVQGLIAAASKAGEAVAMVRDELEVLRGQASVDCSYGLSRGIEALLAKVASGDEGEQTNLGNQRACACEQGHKDRRGYPPIADAPAAAPAGTGSQPLAGGGVRLSPERAVVALQATWEIEETAQVLTEQIEAHPRYLALASMLRRVLTLNDVIMAAVGDSTASVGDLQARLYQRKV